MIAWVVGRVERIVVVSKKILVSFFMGVRRGVGALIYSSSFFILEFQAEAQIDIIGEGGAAEGF